MGLVAEFQQIPVDVFDALDDVPMSAELIQYIDTYVPGGSVSHAEVVFPIRLVEDIVTDLELSGGVARTGDRKFLVPAKELSAIPETKNVIRHNSDWNIYKVEIDPAGALWTIYARQ